MGAFLLCFFFCSSLVRRSRRGSEKIKRRGGRHIHSSKTEYGKKYQLDATRRCTQSRQPAAFTNIGSNQIPKSERKKRKKKARQRSLASGMHCRAAHSTISSQSFTWRSLCSNYVPGGGCHVSHISRGDSSTTMLSPTAHTEETQTRPYKHQTSHIYSISSTQCPSQATSSFPDYSSAHDSSQP